MRSLLLPAVLLGALFAPVALSTASAADERAPIRTAILRTVDADTGVSVQQVQYGYGPRYSYRPYNSYRTYPQYGGYYGNYYQPRSSYYGNYSQPRSSYYGNYSRPYGGYGSFYYGSPGVSFGIGW